MGHMPDGNLAALRIEERRQDRLETEQAALEARAEPVFRHLLQRVDSDVVRLAFEGILDDEYREFAEDLGDGPMRDPNHAGLILTEILQRHLMAEAVREVQGD